MKQTKTLSAVSALAMLAMGSGAAQAAGTTSGTTISNSVSVAYQVGGVDQIPVTGSDSFTIDRKIALTIAETNSNTTYVSPGQVNVAVAFSVTNNSNTAIDIALSATQLSGGAAAHGGTDNFDVSNFALYKDVNGNGLYDAGTDTAISYADELAADSSIQVIAVGTIGLSQVTNDVAAVVLTGVAREAGSASSLGNVITATSGANTTAVDTVLADASGESGDVAYDGMHSDMDDFTVLAATLTIIKTSSVISDPVNNTNDPKIIPGAVVEQCIAVSNAADGASAESVTVTETVPGDTTPVLGSYGVYEETSVTGTGAAMTCSNDGTQDLSAASGNTVTGTLGSIAPGAAKGMRFRVTIQ
jgi:hypothetical protein